MKRTLLICLSALCLFSEGFAAPISDAQAINALLGEGSNQSDDALLGIACAIRNRGTLRGVYGLHNPVVKKAGPKLRERARRAWERSALLYSTTEDVSGGCTYFGCKTDADYFKRTLNYRAVKTIGDITFYQP